MRGSSRVCYAGTSRARIGFDFESGIKAWSVINHGTIKPLKFKTPTGDEGTTEIVHLSRPGREPEA